MQKFVRLAAPFAVLGVAVGIPTPVSAREVSALAGPAVSLVSGLNEPSSMLVWGSVLAGLAYILDDREGRS